MKGLSLATASALLALAACATAADERDGPADAVLRLEELTYPLPPIPAAEAFVGEVLQLYGEREAEVQEWLERRRASR